MKTMITTLKTLLVTVVILLPLLASTQLTGEYMAAIHAPAGNHRVVLFDANDGTLVNDNFINLTALNSGTPKGLAKVGDEIWVTDQIRNRIDRFDLTGAFLSEIGGNVPDGGLSNIRGINVIGNEVWVANAGTANGAPGNSVVRFDFAGNNLGHYLVDGSPWEPIVYNGEVLLSFSASGAFLSRIERYNFNGVALGSWNVPGELNFIQQIAEMSNGHILAAAFSNVTGGNQNGVYEYNTNGTIVAPVGGSLGSGPRGVGQLNNGNIMWTSGGGIFITNVSTGVATNIMTSSAQFIKMINFSDQTVVSLPFIEDFEGADFPPDGWAIYDADGGGNQWERSTLYNHTPGGLYAARHAYGAFGYFENGWLVTPAINFPVGANIQMSFWSYNSFPADYDKNSVLISLGSGNPADGDFVEIWTTPAVTSAWVETVLDLSPAAGNVVYLAFKYEGTFAHTWYIDDIHIDAITIGGVEGIVTDANNGLPITGALVTVGNMSMMTLGDGSYTFDIAGGTHTVFVEKIGYETASAEVDITGGQYTVQNFALIENANPPGAVFAALNVAQTSVNINWALPGGPYEIVYDDGSFENMTAWQQPGNMNALRFTPVAYPAEVIGGSVHIGDGSYPPNGNILTAFEIAIFDQDNSPFGWPNNELTRMSVTPNAFGWVNFTLPQPVTITDGDFYIVMIQGGAFPNCAPIAIDETNPSMRSYSKFETGGAPWTLAGYSDFMMRAIVSGPGGPWGLPAATAGMPFIETTRPSKASISMNAPKPASGYMRDALYIPVETGMPAPEDLLGYRVYRLEQGDEGDESLWTMIGNPAGTVFVDNSWTTIDDGAYRWAVKARYTNHSDPTDPRLSPPSLSNVIGKGWTVDAVTFNVSLSNGATPSGIEVVMVNQLVPDTTYAALSEESGVVVFNNVWKGTYDITVYKFGFELWSITEELTTNKTYNIMLWQFKNPPRNCSVCPYTLIATWDPPIMQAFILEETFTSGSFATNEWTAEPNWALWTGFGNPAPSARFNWSPSITNYSRSLTSKPLMGVGAPTVWFEYDVYLSNYSTATVEKLAVEVLSGNEWVMLKNYDNQGGNIPWTSESIDITEYTIGEFRIRFRAYGDNSFNLNNWNIDNVRVMGVETDFSVMGYNFYLDDLQVAFVTETTLQIPPALIYYGQTYLVGIAAVYQSGVSPGINCEFTSHWLAKPNNFQGESIENAVQLTWEVPFVPPIAATDQERPPATDNQPPAEIEENGNAEFIPYNGPAPAALSSNRSVLWDNGPLVTHVGTGAGGADESLLQTNLGLNTLGFGVQQSASNSIADDFEVGATWTVTSFEFFGYQTGSSTTSTFTGGYLRIWNGDPRAGGSIIWGDLTTNLLESTAFANIYRSSNAPGGATDRPVMQVVCATPGLVLEPGTYWVEYILNGSLSSGPWQPPVSILGQTTTGNASQNQNGTWVDLNDSGTGTRQDVPFIINGTGGGAPAGGLMGYNIYRDGALHAFVEVPELEFWDLNLLPATYKYTATALYDLTYFGLTGTDESLHTPEVEVNVNNFGYPLPFVEEWASANFNFNNWILSDDDGHWRVTTAQGNPVPAAEFTWSPPVKEYWYALISPPLNAAPYTCADIFLDFEIKLNDRNNSDSEKLTVQIFVNGSWIPLKEFKNNGSFNWIHESIHLPMATGKTFHIRFVATGDNSSNILSWFVDNIHVYAECRAPMDLMGHQIPFGYNILLEWEEPNCESGPTGQLLKLSQWFGGPDNGYFQSYNMAYGVVYNLGPYPDATLEFIDFHHASWGTLGTWDYKIHVVDWNTFQLIQTFGPFQTTGNDKWENGIQIGQLMGYGGGLVGIMLEPMGNSPTDAYPCFSADNMGPNGISLFGNIPNWSAFSVSGIGDFLQNLWIRTNFAKDGGLVKLAPVTAGELAAEARMPVNKSEACEPTQNSKLIPSIDNATKDSPTLGYNVYRSSDGGLTYELRNSAPVTQLSFVDVAEHYLYSYKYYVTALYEVCESVPSNIVWVEIINRVEETDQTCISIYPVPATTQLTMVLTDDIRNLRIINFMGQMVFEQNVVKDKVITLNTAGYAPGAYMVQFINESGQTITRRVVITQ